MAERILVVDDEETNRDLLEAVLTDAGYEVALAIDGAAALAVVASDPPDLILLDLMMPGMSGLEVCRTLKGDPRTDPIPVLVVTSYGEPQEKERTLTSGADDVVTKPIEATELLPRVRALLRVRPLRQPLDRTLAYLVELQVERARQRQVAPGRIASGAGCEPTPGGVPILLADDEPLTREFFAELLREQGFQVWTAADGAEALQMLEQSPVEAVVLDLAMPRMSGLEVLARIQSLDPALPVIVLTAQATSENAIAALKLGAFDFIIKGSPSALVALAAHRAVRHRRELVARHQEIAALRAQIVSLKGIPSPEGVR